MGVYCIVVGGKSGFGGWGGIGGWIILQEFSEGGVARNGNGEGFHPFASNIVALETKTWEEGFKQRINTSA